MYLSKSPDARPAAGVDAAAGAAAGTGGVEPVAADMLGNKKVATRALPTLDDGRRR